MVAFINYALKLKKFAFLKLRVRIGYCHELQKVSGLERLEGSAMNNP